MSKSMVTKIIGGLIFAAALGMAYAKIPFWGYPLIMGFIIIIIGTEEE